MEACIHGEHEDLTLIKASLVSTQSNMVPADVERSQILIVQLNIALKNLEKGTPSPCHERRTGGRALKHHLPFPI